MLYLNLNILYFHCSQLAEAIFDYGRGEYEQALKVLGPDFDANNCKVLKSYEPSACVTEVSSVCTALTID